MPSWRFHKNIKKLNNLLKNFETDLYKNRIGSIDNAFDSNFQIRLIYGMKTSEDVKNY